MSKPWGGVGAWALEAERAEAEEREAEEAEAAAAAAAPPEHFPSLKEAAASAGGGKSKKKKATSISLSEFATGTYVGPGGGGRRHPSSSSSLVEPKGLTPDEMLRLPTGPRERSADELEHSRLGGGFRSYGAGGSRGGFPGRRSDDGDGYAGRRPYGGGFDEDQHRGPPSRASDPDQPSRADEVDNWAANKKSFAPSPMDSGRQDRYSSLGGGGAASRADEVDDWSRGKKPLPSRYPAFGSGFRDTTGPSDSDRWARGGVEGPGDRERPRLVLDPPKREVGGVASEPARNRPSPFGAARPREEILAEKGLDWRKMETDFDLKKTSRPTSSQSSRPSSAQSSRPGSPGSQGLATAGEGAPRARPKVNPFGDAKPRELVLEEKGKDWKKIDLDLEHRGVDRPETTEEKILKEEISNLKEALKATEVNTNNESVQVSAEEVTNLREKILIKEKDLELLIQQLDDKVRFGQRGTTDNRPGSGAGRVAAFSQAVLSEDSRSTESIERPRSRGGMGETLPKTVDDKWGFQGIRDRSSFGSRNQGRSRSRERW
ncbi:eukaryotic translation initiation factor 4B1-like [Ananas comosus]|uniref:Eukaryotic translation initiation factor 4B1-like n=1 Tax=Ananas comosus TaxID=4615 RepID=A0A6P5GN13_ANACO|nr:eukaryotic translation initiation factor 4B1-like [Ananas comosus]